MITLRLAAASRNHEATLEDRRRALNAWLDANCNKCLRRVDCEIHMEILIDDFCDGLQRAWELPLVGGVDCPFKVEKVSERDHEM